MESLAILPTGDFNWDLTYRFKGEDYYTEAGIDACYHDIERPVCELSFSGGRWSNLAMKVLDHSLRMGADFVLVPMWPLATALTAAVTPGTIEIPVIDVHDFVAGERICFVPAFEVLDGFEFQTVLSVAAGITVYLTAPGLSSTWKPVASVYPYDSQQAFVMPGFYGIATVESSNWLPGSFGTGNQLANPGPAIDTKVKVQGMMYQGSLPSLGTSLDLVPHSCAYKAPKVYREVLGTENGILDIVPYGSLGKMMFECHWDFYDTSWRTLRNHFIAARGRTYTFHAPTGLFEVKATRTADAGSTTVYLDEYYSEIRDYFPQLRAFPLYPGGSPFTITTTSHSGGDSYVCSALSKELRAGDKLCLSPLVRFEDNSLTFKFNGIHKCQATAVFRAVTS